MIRETVLASLPREVGAGFARLGPESAIRSKDVRGTIKWYSEPKGFGWITLESGEDVYLHFSAVRFDGVPRSGEAVTLDILEGPNGKQALRVRRTKGAP